MSESLLKNSNNEIEYYLNKFDELIGIDPEEAKEYLEKADQELKRTNKIIGIT
jgi:hypothetical protein